MSFTKIGRPEFIQKLDALEAALKQDSSSLISCDLKIVHRSGFSWVLLSLLKPFYALFGKDPYSHVRTNRVVHSVLEFCRVNKHVFLHEEDLVERIETKILEPLNQKTRWVYANAIQGAKAGIREFLPHEPKHLLPKFSITESHYEGKWPDDLTILGITPRKKHRSNRLFMLSTARTGPSLLPE